MKLSIIIPTKDREGILQRTVKCLIDAIDGIEAEIIIVNDSDRSLLLEQNDFIKIIQNKKSGAASARNTGVSESTGELLLFLDDDMIVSKTNIQKTLSLHGSRTKCAFNFFWLYPPDLIETLPSSSLGRYILRHLLFTNSYRVKINGRTSEFIEEGLTSQYFSILKEDFRNTGGYDENIPYAGMEDFILYKRLAKNNIQVYICPSDIIFHNESDRLLLHPMLERARSGAITISKARSLGHETSLSFTWSKKLLYPFLIHLKPLIYSMAMRVPNHHAFDFIYFKLTNLLLGLSSYKGYYVDSK